MAQKDESNAVSQPVPLKISRIFLAPRDLVFKAWSSAEHVKRWFAPTGFTTPEATVEMHAGGRFEVCMRAPDGTSHWAKGVFAEVSPPERLVIDFYALDAKDDPLFRAYTEVDFTYVPGGTRVDIVQTYTLLQPVLAAPMVAGAPIGWGQTLDKLEAEVARLRESAASSHSVVHATFHLERTYDAPIELVFKALSDKAAKSKWFAGPAGKWREIERVMEFRVGGREKLIGQFDGGDVTSFDAIYYDIIPGERIVYSYEMHKGDKKISVSLATMQLKPAGSGGTTLSVTEQGAFLDGYDDAGAREHGTGFLLDQIGASLRT
jgi:uncharacterized protein YndB with AHSA1/START domain